mmetsp:Transcript_15798/g.11468  ORF Transcript_15798/g.11468 Transcript_15798/m.11468 type:complete len:84 (+) Transcript_15798:179-430(+)
MVGNITVEEDCSNLDSLPTVTFQLDNISYTLSPSDYVFQFEDLRDGWKCAIGIVEAEFLNELNYFILGNIFIRKYYTFFDMDE